MENEEDREFEFVDEVLTTEPELLPKIVVKDPVTHDTWEHGKFTTYLICIKTDHPAFHLPLSAVRRRFSEVRWLYSLLKQNFPLMPLPTPPPKKMLAVRFEKDFIQKRMKDIEDFLNQLLITDTLLSDASLHFFLQTDLTTEEIDEYIEGKLPESIVESAWKNSGHLHSSSFIVSTNHIPYEPQEIIMNEEDTNSSGRQSTSSEELTSDASDRDATQLFKQAIKAKAVHFDNKSTSPSVNGVSGLNSQTTHQNGIAASSHSSASQSVVAEVHANGIVHEKEEHLTSVNSGNPLASKKQNGREILFVESINSIN